MRPLLRPPLDLVLLVLCLLLVAAWIDAFRHLHPDEAGFPCCVSDITSEPGYPLRRRIDYLFVVPGDTPLHLIDSQLVLTHPARLANGWPWASDHVGLFTKSEWRP